jgi:hypothetical protein
MREVPRRFQIRSPILMRGTTREASRQGAKVAKRRGVGLEIRARAPARDRTRKSASITITSTASLSTKTVQHIPTGPRNHHLLRPGRSVKIILDDRGIENGKLKMENY